MPHRVMAGNGEHAHLPFALIWEYRKAYAEDEAKTMHGTLLGVDSRPSGGDIVYGRRLSDTSAIHRDGACKDG